MEAPRLTYSVKCPFCHREHVSAYFDEVEEEILGCREQSPEWKQGNLATFADPGIRPVSCETEARAGLDGGTDYPLVQAV